MAMEYGRFVHEVLGNCMLAATLTAGISGLAAAASPLGAVYTPAATTFSIWSPDNSDVQLSLQGQTDPLPMARLPDTDEFSDVYSVTVPGDHHLKTYNFRISGRPVRDPLGVMVTPSGDSNVVVDLSQTEPTDGWAASPPLALRTDAVIYEVHVRDFTRDPSSGVSAAKRGKFLGMVEHGTRIEGRPTGIDHLVDLGVTHVQIMPMFDYRSCSVFTAPNPPDCYNWGFDPQNYNVLKKTTHSFLATPSPGFANSRP
jgi:pullulanase